MINKGVGSSRKRFQIALGLSVWLHLLLILGWHPNLSEWNISGGRAVTVTFRPQHAIKGESLRSPKEASDSQEKVVLQPSTTLAQQKNGLKNIGTPLSPQSMQITHRVTSSTAVDSSVVPRTGAEVPVDHATRGVTVTIVIGESGKVAQIFWNKLPALTDNQLQQVEESIRARSYLGSIPGAILNENIDVLSLISRGNEEEKVLQLKR